MDEKSHIWQFCEVKLSSEKENQHGAHVFIYFMSVSVFEHM